MSLQRLKENLKTALANAAEARTLHQGSEDYIMGYPSVEADLWDREAEKLSQLIKQIETGVEI